MKRTSLLISTALITAVSLSGCGHVSADKGDNGSIPVITTTSESDVTANDDENMDMQTSDTQDSDTSEEPDNKKKSDNSLLGNLFSSHAKMSELKMNSVLFEAVPNCEEVAKKYSYYIANVSYDSYDGYFEREQYNLDEKGRVVSLITTEGNTDQGDEYLTEIDDLSELYDSGDFYFIYNYTYDDAGRKTEALVYDRFDSHTDPSHTLYYQYNDDGSVQTTGVEYGESEPDESYSSVTAYDEHDNMVLSRMGTIYSYTYDGDGNVTSKTVNIDENTNYTYDYSYKQGRVSEQVMVYYDEQGNEGHNRYIYTYDNGNLTTVTKVFDNGSDFTAYEYTYGDDGLLLTARNNVDKKTITYEYF